jgi:outer membrane protein TolC
MLTLSPRGAMAGEAVTPGDNNGCAPAGCPSADDFQALDGQVRGLIELLLANNPRLLAARSRSRSSSERIAQEGSLPDPMLTYRYYLRTPETRVGPQEQMLELSQGVPWGGKRRLQADRAESIASGESWEAEELGRMLVARLKHLYFETAYLQEALTVNAEERDLLQRFESIALRRYSTGQGIQQSVIKVQTDISRLTERNRELRERLDVVLRQIAESVGRPGEPLTLSTITLNMPEVAPERRKLEEWAVREHPRVRAIERRIEADRIWARRRKLDSKPDFRFGVGYGLVGNRDDPAGLASPPTDNGQDIISLMVGINIPIQRQRIRAGIAEASESGLANEASLRAVRNALRDDIQEALLRLESSIERGRMFSDVIIPQAEESLASAEASYTTDRLGFLDLLEAERVLFQSRLTYHRLVSDSWIALADLELAVARPYPAAPPGVPDAGGDAAGSTS